MVTVAVVEEEEEEVREGATQENESDTSCGTPTSDTSTKQLLKQH